MDRVTNSKGTVIARFVLITVEVAKAMLSTMVGNRNMRKRAVQKYAADMVGGLWEDNGEPIHVVDGRLVNGQHRLNAVIASGVPIELLVVYTESHDRIDTGMKRTPGDFLMDIDNGKDVAAAAAWVLRYEATTPGNRIAIHDAVEARHTMAQDRARSDERLQLSVSFCKTDAFSGWLPCSIASFVHYMGGCTDQVKADEFIMQLKTGAGLSKGDAAYALRATLLSPRSQKAKPHRDVIAALTAKAWLHHEVGTKCGVLRYSSTEPFPRFRCDIDGGDPE